MLRAVFLRIILVALTFAFGCGDRDESDDSASNGPASGFVRTAEIVQGRRLYKQNGCYVCHGDKGKGDGKIAHTLDPRPQDLADMETYKRGADLAQIMETIEKGIGVKKLIMPGYPHLSLADRRRIARYLRSLQVEESGKLDSTADAG